MKLVLIRHGESEWNKLNLFTGWTDVELSEKGVEEAKEGGKALAAAGFDFDICYTSYLKRAIHTLQFVLDELDRNWLPVIKTWKLNERHYGDLQGLNKAETAEKYGEAQVKIWRRSFDIAPPVLAEGDARCPYLQTPYRGINKAELSRTESLKDTIARAIPYFESVIKKDMLAGKRVLIAAHGNSLRALIKYFEHLSDEQIVQVNLPTGVPLVYEFDEGFNVLNKAYLGDQEKINAKINAVANQGKAK